MSMYTTCIRWVFGGIWNPTRTLQSKTQCHNHSAPQGQSSFVATTYNSFRWLLLCLAAFSFCEWMQLTNFLMICTLDALCLSKNFLNFPLLPSAGLMVIVFNFLIFFPLISSFQFDFCENFFILISSKNFLKVLSCMPFISHSKNLCLLIFSVCFNFFI